MRNLRRALWIFSLVAATLAPAGAWAAGLGEAQLHSALSQALQLEIALLGEDASALEASCFRLQAPRAPGDDLPWLTEARLSLKQRAGATYLLITTRHGIPHPALMVGVTIDCGTQVHREYPLLLAPAEVDSAPARRPSAVQATAEEEGVLPARALPARAPSSRPRRAAPVSADQAAGSKKHRIAEAEPPAPRVTSRSATQDRLTVKATPETESGLHAERELEGRAPVSAAEHQRLAREQQLVFQVDDRINRQIEVDERIRQLEAISRRLESENLRLQGLIDKSTRQSSSAILTRGIPLYWVLAVALGLGITAFLLFLRVRRRREEPFIEAPEPEYAPDDLLAEAGTEVDVDLEALTTADIWPDQGGQAAPEGPSETPDWDHPTLSPAKLGPSSLISIDDSIEEHDSAVELAEIMMSFGRIQGAAETLVEFIRANPKQAVRPWVKLLEVYKAANLRAEFDALAQKLNKTFNVRAITWEEFDQVKQIRDTIEQMPHITNTLIKTWNTREAQAYTYKLLRDNREGTRQGFALGIVDDLLMLSGVLEIKLGAFHPTPEEEEEMFTIPSQEVGPTALSPTTETAPASEPDTGATKPADDFALDLDFSETLDTPTRPDPRASHSMLEFNLDEDLPPIRPREH